MKKLMIIALTLFASVAHAGYTDDLNRLYKECVAKYAQAKVDLAQDNAAAEEKFQRTINSSEADTVADVFNAAVNQRNLDWKLAADNYNHSIAVATQQHRIQSNAVCLHYLNRSCDWNY